MRLKVQYWVTIIMPSDNKVQFWQKVISEAAMHPLATPVVSLP
jgi:hypothetical protein